MNHLLSCPKIRRGQEVLTPEQAASADQFAQERIAAMLSTAAIDEREAEEHLRAAYRVAGLKQQKPVRIRWFDSPVAFALTLFSNEGGSVKKSLRQRVWPGVQESVCRRVRDRVEDRVRDRVEDRVSHSVRDRVEDRVENSMRGFLEGGVSHGVWDLLEDRVRNFLNKDIDPLEDIDVVESRVQNLLEMCVQNLLGAYHHAGWLSSSRFFHELFEENNLIHLALFNEMVSGYYLESKQAWLVRKPIRLERDAQGRLHSADGMCLHYWDGQGLYAWHGTRCEEKLILHPEQITREEWMNERDLEIRHIMEERIGNERFIEMLGSRCIDRGQRADLIEVDLGHDPEQVARFVHVKDASTERVSLRVPPTFDQADAALAWTFGLEGQDYRPA